MSTAIKAICWEYWQENRWRFFIVLTVVLGFPTFLHTVPDYFSGSDPMSLNFLAWLEMAGICAFLYVGQYSQTKGRLGFHRHLYIKPVGTHTLVLTRLLLMILTAVSIHLLVALLYYALAGVQLPIAVPILALVTLTLCTQAIAWTLSGTPATQVIATVLTIALLIWWYLENIPIEGGAPGKANLVNAIWLVPIMIAAAILCFLGVKLDRKNQRLSFARLWDKIISFLCLLFPGKNARLITPQGAQFWLLWRTRGWIAPCLNLIGVVITVLFYYVFPKDSEEIYQTFFASFLMINLYAIPPIAAIIIAEQGSKVALASHISTRPLTNTSLLLNYLKVCLASLVAGWCIFLLGTGIFEIRQTIMGRESLIGETLNTYFNFRAVKNSPGKEVAYLVFNYSLYLWTSMGLTGSLILTGRRWPFLCVCGLFAVMAHVYFLPLALGLTRAAQIIETLLLSVWGVSCVGGTIYAFIAARKRKCIHKMVPWCALLICCLLLLFCVCLWHHVAWELLQKPLMLMSILALLSLIFLPLAAAPLAIAWNRHR